MATSFNKTPKTKFSIPHPINNIGKVQHNSKHLTKQPFDYFPFGGSFGCSESRYENSDNQKPIFIVSSL